MYNMNFYIALLGIITIVLYVDTYSRQLLNKPLGKILFSLIVLYLFYQSPILGIFLIIVIILFKDNYISNNNNNIPLEIIYKTKPQTPVSEISDFIVHESGLELLSKELNLRPKESNRDSLVTNTLHNCNDDDDVLCLFNNEPNPVKSNSNGKNIIYSNI